jgi:spore coat polysaccharide biosynthesis protein SpsF
MKVIAIIQARMASKRFRGKIMKEINGMPMIFWQIMRLKNSKYLDKIVVATTEDPSDDEFCSFLKKHNFIFYRGDIKDVYSRYVNILKLENPDYFVRITADSPLFMSEILDKMLVLHMSSGADYTTNNLPPTFPDGLDIEIVNRESLINLGYYKLEDYEKEHVTVGIYSRENVFKIQNYSNRINLSQYRWTVDYQKDFEFVSRIFREFQGVELAFSFEDVLKVLARKPEIKNEIPANKRDESLRQVLNLPKSVSKRFILMPDKKV